MIKEAKEKRKKSVTKRKAEKVNTGMLQGLKAVSKKDTTKY